MLLWGGQAAALSSVDRAAINNDWVNWVADQVCVTSTSIGGALVGKDNPEKAFNFFLQKGLSKEQSAAFVGNFMQESGVNPAANQPDGPGRGIAQWSEGGRWDHDPSDNLRDFANGQPMEELNIQLNFVWYELTETHYSSALSSLKSKTTLSDMVLAVANEYEQAGVIGPRLGFAQDVLDTYGGGSVAQNVSLNSNTGCVSGSGAVGGNIVQTALNYAWDTTGHGPDEADAKPSYRSDMPKYNGSTDNQPFSDCGVYISTVMIASGADPDYPKRDTRIQTTYLEAHPDKYQEIPNVTNTSQLVPGDILINDQHTFMFVGKQPKGYDSVGASLHSHVPQRSGFGDGFRVFRYLGSKTNTGLPA
jgi:hypothetical protein